jgi:hypothetical protein
VAKTYTAPTSVAVGDALTASLYNTYVGTNIANLIVPPTFMVSRSTNQTGYVSQDAITWNASAWDSDGMVSGATVTVRTAGIYLLTFCGVLDATATITDCTPIIKINGTDIFDEHKEPFSATVMSFTSSIVANLAVNDLITAAIGVVGGSAYIIRGSGTVSTSQTRLSGVWIGRTS